MKKLLVIILIVLLVAAGVGYFGMQWKVRKTLDEFFRSTPFINGSYSNFSIDLNGKMTIHDLIIEAPLAAVTLDINSVSFATGNFWETLSLEKSLKDGQLPTKMQIEIDQLSFDLPTSISQPGAQPGLLAQLAALGCGQLTSLSPANYYDMGISRLTFDLTMGYDYDARRDEFVSSADLYFDGLGRIEMDQTVIGLYPLMDNYHDAFYELDPSNISTTNVSVAYTDLGYNNKYVSFCAIEAGLEPEEWREHHLKMIAAVIDKIALTADFDLLAAYRQLLQDRSYIEVDLRPLTGFNISDLQFYGVSELIDLVDLKVAINDEPLEIGDLGWDQDRFDALDLNEIRGAFRLANVEDDVDVVAESAAARSAASRMLIDVPLSSLGRYQYRNVQVERNDGILFTGQMISVNSEQIVVRTRFSTGFTDLPLDRDQIAVVKVYPE
jgi:hypothetical protein